MDEGQRVPAAGRSISHYEIVRKLGAGGMGVVYMALDTKLARPVALKFLPPQIGGEGVLRERFLQEARAASALDHPNIGAIYGIEDSPDGQMFIVMAYYAGETLSERIKRGAVPLSQALDVAIQIAQGLSEAHARGIVHRDIKPSNIIVTPQGVAKIVDFGLAKLAGSTQLTMTGTTVGTVAYMSPEQAAGHGDHRSDLWSLGVVLFEMLCGRLPFQGASYPAMLLAITRDEPAPMTQQAPPMEQIVRKALAKNPAERYQRALDMVDDLRTARAAASATESAVTESMVIQDTSGRTSVPASPPRGVMTEPLPRRTRLRARTAAAVLVPVLALATLLIPAARRSLSNWFGPREKHVAVLPFSNVGKDPANAALCEGLVETLTGKLSSLEQVQGSLWVVPASEVRAKNIASAADARRSFGVNLVVTGSVQRVGPSVRLVVSLVDAASLRQLGSQVLDDAGGDFAVLQDGAVTQLARLLELERNPQGRPAGQQHAAAPAAYEAYLTGLGYMRRYDKPGNLDSAIGEFAGAIKTDPQFALAHAGLGEAYRVQFRVTKDPRWLQQALQSCNRAIEIDSQLAPAHVTLGLVQDGAGQRDLAIVHFQRALELDPHNAEAIAGMASTYEAMGRLAEAEASFKKAAALRPDYWSGVNSLGAFYHRHARYQDAEVQFRRVLELTPDNPAAHSNLGVVLSRLEDTAGARKMYEKSIALSPTYNAYANLANLDSAEERYSLAADMYRKALKLNDKDYRQWGSLARALELGHGSSSEVQELFGRAASMAEEAIRAQPGDARALGLLASYEVHLKRNEKAFEHVNQSLLRAPEDPEVLEEAAEIFEMLGKREEALRLIQQAMARGYAVSRIKRTPELRKLQQDPAFRSLLK
ncbi:MAG: protein kinase [Candidatus Solibacter sp.]|nr:protein kinase [Candidatus Solibacter sp.]